MRKIPMWIVIPLVIIFVVIIGNHLPDKTKAKTAVTSPPVSAVGVAASHGCIDFKDTGKAARGMVTDSGTCRIGNRDFIIDMFATKAARGSWLKGAWQRGVVPSWQTDLSVMYKVVPKP